MNGTKMITAMSTSSFELRRISIIDLGGHISELAVHRVATVADTVQIGDRVPFVSSTSIRNAADSSFPSGRPTHRNRSSRTYNRHKMPTEYGYMAQAS